MFSLFFSFEAVACLHNVLPRMCPTPEIISLRDGMAVESEQGDYPTGYLNRGYVRYCADHSGQTNHMASTGDGSFKFLILCCFLGLDDGPIHIPMPIHTPAPIPIPMPVPTHIHALMPMPMPMPIPMPMQIPMPIPTPMHIPLPIPLSIPVPMPITIT